MDGTGKTVPRYHSSTSLKKTGAPEIEFTLVIMVDALTPGVLVSRADPNHLHVRNASNFCHDVAPRNWSLCAINDRSHRNKRHPYSITSLAVASNVGGTVRSMHIISAHLN